MASADGFLPIKAVVNHGTIVAVHLEGRVAPVFLDHRPFHWLLINRTRGNFADDLLGQRARVISHGALDETLEFDSDVLEFEDDGDAHEFCEECGRDLAWQHAPDCASGAAHNILSGENHE